MGECEVDMSFCDCVPVAGKFWKFLDLLSNYQFLKRNSASWGLSVVILETQPSDPLNVHGCCYLQLGIKFDKTQKRCFEPSLRRRVQNSYLSTYQILSTDRAQYGYINRADIKCIKITPNVFWFYGCNFVT